MRRKFSLIYSAIEIAANIHWLLQFGAVGLITTAVGGWLLYTVFDVPEWLLALDIFFLGVLLLAGVQPVCRRISQWLVPVELIPLCGKRDVGAPHHYLLWSALQVKNRTPGALEDVEVRIVDVIPEHDLDHKNRKRIGIGVPERWTPINVTWSRRNAPLGATSIAIPCDSERICDMAFSNNSNGPPALWAIANLGQQIDGSWNSAHLISGVNLVRVAVSSRNERTVERDFYLECHPNYLNGPRAHFEFELWEDYWRAKRQEDAIGS